MAREYAHPVHVRRDENSLNELCGIAHSTETRPVSLVLTCGVVTLAVCDRAADYGMKVGLEFLPFTNVRTASDAMAIVGAADRPNGGVCVDIWHHRRGANDGSLIEAIPVDKVMAVQINDGPMKPQLDDYKDDCLLNRVAPGDGEMHVAEFVAMLLRMGTTAPWSLEVCQQGAAAGEDHVRHCADQMRAVLTDARCANGAG